jgi:hypothetical protein
VAWVGRLDSGVCELRRRERLPVPAVNNPDVLQQNLTTTCRMVNMEASRTGSGESVPLRSFHLQAVVAIESFCPSFVPRSSSVRRGTPPSLIPQPSAVLRARRVRRGESMAFLIVLGSDLIKYPGWWSSSSVFTPNQRASTQPVPKWGIPPFFPGCEKGINGHCAIRGKKLRGRDFVR